MRKTFFAWFVLLAALLFLASCAVPAPTEPPKTVYLPYDASCHDLGAPPLRNGLSPQTLLFSPLLASLPSDGGETEWEFVAAQALEDVTEERSDLLSEYGLSFSDGLPASGYVFRVTLNPNASWQDGTPLRAQAWAEGVRRSLQTENGGIGADLLAGGSAFVHADEPDLYIACSYREAMADHRAKTVLRVSDFRNIFAFSDGNGDACPTYLSVSDLTVYTDAVGNTFSGATLFSDYNVYFQAGNRSLFLKEPNPHYGASFAEVGVRAENDGTLLFVCASRTDLSLFRSYLSSLLPVGPTEGETPLSCGPYRIAFYEHGKCLTLEKNPAWWGWTDGTDALTSSVTLPSEQTVLQYQADEVRYALYDASAAPLAFCEGHLSLLKNENVSLPTETGTYLTAAQTYLAEGLTYPFPQQTELSVRWIGFAEDAP